MILIYGWWMNSMDFRTLIWKVCEKEASDVLQKTHLGQDNTPESVYIYSIKPLVYCLCSYIQMSKYDRENANTEFGYFLVYLYVWLIEAESFNTCIGFSVSGYCLSSLLLLALYYMICYFQQEVSIWRKIETSRVQWEDFLNRSRLHDVSKTSELSFVSDTAWVSVVSSNTSSTPIQRSLKCLAKSPEIFADKPRTKSPIKLRTTSNWKLWASSFPSSVTVSVSRLLNTPGALEFFWWLRPLTQTPLYVNEEIEWSWLAKDA